MPLLNRHNPTRTSTKEAAAADCHVRRRRAARRRRALQRRAAGRSRTAPAVLASRPGFRIASQHVRLANLHASHDARLTSTSLRGRLSSVPNLHTPVIKRITPKRAHHRHIITTFPSPARRSATSRTTTLRFRAFLRPSQGRRQVSRLPAVRRAPGPRSRQKGCPGSPLEARGWAAVGLSDAAA